VGFLSSLLVELLSFGLLTFSRGFLGTLEVFWYAKAVLVEMLNNREQHKSKTMEQRERIGPYTRKIEITPKHSLLSAKIDACFNSNQVHGNNEGESEGVPYPLLREHDVGELGGGHI
jgi:hypothetical protein